MKLFIATGNKTKMEEAKAILGKYGIGVEGVAVDVDEDAYSTLEETALAKALAGVKKTGKPTIGDDGGFFMDATPGFPGVQSKRNFQKHGHEGLLRMIEGKSRSACFRIAIGLALPSGETHLFTGECRGRVPEKLPDKWNPEFPFERMFVPDGFSETFSEMTREQKHEISHRGEELRKLVEWLSQKERQDA
ncbi:non-canonical purine NTP pyrophosphatase [archaeon]|nr:non-canonical purine NTP pyrophosphatase [archaeon]